VSSKKKSRLVSILEYLFFLGLGFFLLWLSFRKLDLNKVWSDILHADYLWMFYSLFFAIASHIVRSIRWNMLINSMGYKTRLSSTFYSLMVGYMANTAVPRMGEFMRCGVLSKKEKIPFTALFGTVISERLLDMLMLLLIIFLVIVFQIDLVGTYVGNIFNPIFHNMADNMMVLVMVSGSVLLFFVLSIWLLYRFRNRIKKLSFYAKVRLFLDGLWDGIKTVLRLKQKWLFIFYTIIIWLFYVIMVYFPMKMLPETSILEFKDAFTLLGIGSLGIVAPVPGGIGAYHFIIKSVLYELYGINGAAAGSFAAITHAGQTLLNVGVGGFSYLMLMVLSKKQKPLNE
jgi:uncharacterized protein (TIRG00374 family)